LKKKSIKNKNQHGGKGKTYSRLGDQVKKWDCRTRQNHDRISQNKRFSGIDFGIVLFTKVLSRTAQFCSSTQIEIDR
jgi:hypothetical protein